jgi:hypothetical protein
VEWAGEGEEGRKRSRGPGSTKQIKKEIKEGESQMCPKKGFKRFGKVF